MTNEDVTLTPNPIRRDSPYGKGTSARKIKTNQKTAPDMPAISMDLTHDFSPNKRVAKNRKAAVLIKYPI